MINCSLEKWALTRATRGQDRWPLPLLWPWSARLANSTSALRPSRLPVRRPKSPGWTDSSCTRRRGAASSGASRRCAVRGADFRPDGTPTSTSACAPTPSAGFSSAWAATASTTWTRPVPFCARPKSWTVRGKSPGRATARTCADWSSFAIASFSYLRIVVSHRDLHFCLRQRTTFKRLNCLTEYFQNCRSLPVFCSNFCKIHCSLLLNCLLPDSIHDRSRLGSTAILPLPSRSQTHHYLKWVQFM